MEAITLHTEVVKLSLSWCFHLISHGNGLQAVAVDSLFYCQVGHQSVEINLKHLLVLTVETFSPLHIHNGKLRFMRLTKKDHLMLSN